MHEILITDFSAKSTFTPRGYKYRSKNRDFRPRASSGDCRSREFRDNAVRMGGLKAP